VSSRQRIGLLLAAAVVLVGGFVAARAADDDGGDDPAPVATAPATAPAGTGDPATTPEEAATAEEPPAPAPRVERVRIEGRQPVGEVRTLRFRSGDTVRLRFSSDLDEEVHIHGYDRYVDVPAGGAITDRFTADAEGIFEIESHGSGALLARLEVSP
jgi:FtsP/CotA-like multicopper oxidase with cupredoxin domain